MLYQPEILNKFKHKENKVDTYKQLNHQSTSIELNIFKKIKLNNT